MRQGGEVMAFIVGKKQKKAAKLFAEGKKTREVAALVGVHRTTLWRWWQHEEMWECSEKVWDARKRKILASCRFVEPLAAELEDPDPFKAQAAACRILDKYGPYLYGSAQPNACLPRGYKSVKK